MSEVPIRPAATVVVLRGEPVPEVLLLLRHGQHGFMPNIWVFPGGRVEDSDGDGEDGARAAAIRETHEEAGVALSGPLRCFARWVTPRGEKRRYDTRFYLAEVAPTCVAEPDRSEVIDALWLTADAALARHRAGKLALAPPTWWTLEALRRLQTLDAIRAWAAVEPVVAIEPALTLEDGTAVVSTAGANLRIPGEPVSGRLTLVKGTWSAA